MDMKRALFTGMACAALLALAGCSKETVGGAAVGAVGAGAAYEYQMHEQLDELEAQRKAGEISEEEYERRKQEIKDRSIIE